MEEITLETVDELERKPRDLYGMWKGKVPDDFDIDAALYEIRHEWEKEFEEIYGSDQANEWKVEQKEFAPPRRPGSAIGKFFILSEDDEHLADFDLTHHKTIG